MTTLLPYTNDLSLAIDNGKCVDVAYFDYSKAFDSVRHDYLIIRLDKLGIRGPLLICLVEYFKDRTQVGSHCVQGCLSTERPVTSGVI